MERSAFREPQGPERFDTLTAPSEIQGAKSKGVQHSAHAKLPHGFRRLWIARIWKWYSQKATVLNVVAEQGITVPVKNFQYTRQIQKEA